MGPFGLALTGVLLDRVGGAATALACGSLMALLGLVTMRNPHVRDAPPLAFAERDDGRHAGTPPEDGKRAV
jgi:hypothetical protein